ncbi:MAG: type II toxin-antitoxin system Phd/YefM family antitoxin [Hymenobacter sp.]|nr:type II toxin-antitoxin system Phd/YefM family antitoxin [Hymenobacter sp.]
MTTVSYSEARANLAALMEKSANEREAIIISRRGKADMVLLPAADLAGLLETMHLLRSPRNAERLLGAIARSEQQAGVSLSVEQVAQRFGLEEN